MAHGRQGLYPSGPGLEDGMALSLPTPSPRLVPAPLAVGSPLPRLASPRPQPPPRAQTRRPSRLYSHCLLFPHPLLSCPPARYPFLRLLTLIRSPGTAQRPEPSRANQPISKHEFHSPQYTPERLNYW